MQMRILDELDCLGEGQSRTWFFAFLQRGCRPERSIRYLFREERKLECWSMKAIVIFFECYIYLEISFYEFLLPKNIS